MVPSYEEHQSYGPHGEADHMTASGLPRVCSLVFSPDSRMLASGGKDGRMLLWDVRGGVLLKELQSPGKEFIVNIAFSPDGDKVAALTKTGRVLVWSTSTMARVHVSLPVLPTSVNDFGHKTSSALAFSVGGNHLIAWETWVTEGPFDPGAVRFFASEEEDPRLPSRHMVMSVIWDTQRHFDFTLSHLPRSSPGEWVRRDIAEASGRQVVWEAEVVWEDESDDGNGTVRAYDAMTGQCLSEIEVIEK